MPEPINIGLIGFGNIGSGVVRALNRNEKIINAALPRPIRIARIADIDLKTKRDARYDPRILTNDSFSVARDPNIDIIIELVGGYGVARKIVETALRSKKHVVTANKALLARYGADLFNLARKRGVSLLFEASVGAGIPVIQSITESFAANRVHIMRGIMNGTTNFILTQMERQGRDFEDVLKEAQEKGYAEPDPSFDVKGYDTAHKLSILATLAFRQDIRFRDVFVQGITRVRKEDLSYASELGYAVKLLGIARLLDNGWVEIRAHPTLIPRDNPLASVSGVFNAIEMVGDPIGPQMLYGHGAGWGSTSSAILSDAMRIARAVATNSLTPQPPAIPIGDKKVKSIEDLETEYYIRMTLRDIPGMLAKVAGIFGKEKISVKAVLQKTSDPGGYASAIFITHKSREASLQSALGMMAKKKICKDAPFVLRVEE